jgi:hypothetical protein
VDPFNEFRKRLHRPFLKEPENGKKVTTKQKIEQPPRETEKSQNISTQKGREI